MIMVATQSIACVLRQVLWDQHLQEINATGLYEGCPLLSLEAFNIPIVLEVGQRFLVTSNIMR